MKVDQSTPMASTRPPLAKSSKKPRLQVQNTSSIKDKKVMEEEGEGAKVPISRNVSPMRIDEAIASATKSPALQRAFELIRSDIIQERKRKTMEEGKSNVIAPKGMENKNKGATSSKEILDTIPEDQAL